VAQWKPPLAPYPPDIAEESAREVDCGALVDTVAIDRDWANVRFPRFAARRVALRRCRLTGAELAEATLRDVTLDECRIDLVGLRYARLERAVFRDCRMAECDFYGSSLKDVRFERCELREATFSNCTLERVVLRGCDLAGARGAEVLRGARVSWNDIIESAARLATTLGIDIVE